MSVPDLENSTFYEMFSKIENICKLHCWRPNSEEIYYVTQVVDTEADTNIELSVYTPSQPTTITESYPEMELIDFVIYLSSCLGLWIGWSVLDTNRLVQGITRLISRLKMK